MNDDPFKKILLQFQSPEPPLRLEQELYAALSQPAARAENGADWTWPWLTMAVAASLVMAVGLGLYMGRFTGGFQDVFPGGGIGL